MPSRSNPFVRLRGRSPVVGQTAGSSTASIATFSDAPIGGWATRCPVEAITLSTMALTVIEIDDALRMLPCTPPFRQRGVRATGLPSPVGGAQVR